MNEIEIYNEPKASNRQLTAGGEELCKAECPAPAPPYVCTLHKGHDLSHEAGLLNNKIIAAWS